MFNFTSTISLANLKGFRKDKWVVEYKIKDWMIYVLKIFINIKKNYFYEVLR